MYIAMLDYDRDEYPVGVFSSWQEFTNKIIPNLERKNASTGIFEDELMIEFSIPNGRWYPDHHRIYLIPCTVNTFTMEFYPYTSFLKGD